MLTSSWAGPIQIAFTFTYKNSMLNSLNFGYSFTSPEKKNVGDYFEEIVI